MKRYILCCVSTQNINSEFLSKVETVLLESSVIIERSEVLSEQGLKAVDFYLALTENVEPIKMALLQLSNSYQVDLALIPHDESRLNVKLIVFDMDSTLIQHEVIDEMAMVHGVGEEVKIITERAMNGELDFDQSLRKRVSLLKGLDKASMEEIGGRLQLTPGVEKLILEVRKRGIKTAVISGGFKYFAEEFKRRLEMDYAFANDLQFDGNVLSGELVGKIINAEEKARLVEELASKENISLDQVVAVGDGANDLLMLSKAGFGIAFHAKEKVRKAARHQLNFGPMTTLLYFLGIPGNHLDEKL